MQVQRDSFRITRRNALKITGGAAFGTLLPIRGAAQDAGTPAASPDADLGYFPSPIEGVPDAFYRYPENPQPSVASTPGNGGTVRVTQTSDKRIRPREENQYWQELEERLGVELEVQIIPGAAYAERMATMIAGGDFPDLVMIYTLMYPQASEFMIQGAFTDLTAHLDGDARSAYPNLAAYPEYAFENSKLNGVAYGVPSPVALQGNFMYYRSDWLSALSMEPPSNAEEYFAMLDGFTNGDPDGNGAADTLGTSFERLDAMSQRFIHGMFRVGAEGNGWIVNDDGTFTHVIETDAFLQALEYSREVWDAGVCHPDSLTQTSNEIREQLMAGSVGSGPNAYINLGLIRDEAAKINSDASIMGMVPPGHDGGEGVAYNVDGYFGQYTIPSPVGQDDARVEELLRIVDYFAAPFGSEEYTFMVYGTEGVHHNVLDDGSIERTEQGEQEILDFLTIGGLNTLFNANKDECQYMQQLMIDQTSIGLFSPTANLFSPTSASKASELDQFYTDNKIAIGTGREPLEAIDDWIANWKSRGGDEIRAEYEAAYAEAQEG